uniref:SRPBCC domain-containing protein n=1 Tax=Cyclophora tenuis TaxID=216820 RepID=A0A6U1SAK4_CYCTE
MPHIDLMEGEEASLTHDDGTTYSISSELLIDAPPEKVWAVLTDFDKLSEWSPGMIKFEGEFRKDGPAKVTFLIGVGSHTQIFNHPLIHFDEGKMFGWSAPIPHMGMKDNHKYIVEPTDDGKTKFIQTDQFHGQGAHLIGGMLANGALSGYVAFNRALKKRVEEM